MQNENINQPLLPRNHLIVDEENQNQNHNLQDVNCRAILLNVINENPTTIPILIFVIFFAFHMIQLYSFGSLNIIPIAQDTAQFIENFLWESLWSLKFIFNKNH